MGLGCIEGIVVILSKITACAARSYILRKPPRDLVPASCGFCTWQWCLQGKVYSKKKSALRALFLEFMVFYR
jgi:hypothetical protein